MSKRLEKQHKKLKEDLKEEQKDIKEDAKEYLETLQKLQAEFENYRKRTEKEKLDIIKYAKEDLILKLLHVLDNFERAMDAITKTDNVKDVQIGIDLIFNQLNKILENEGLKAIEAKGKKFNPNEHEAILFEDSDEEEHKILQEIEKGYMLKDKLIRPAKVKVSKGGNKNE